MLMTWGKGCIPPAVAHYTYCCACEYKEKVERRDRNREVGIYWVALYFYLSHFFSAFFFCSCIKPQHKYIHRTVCCYILLFLTQTEQTDKLVHLYTPSSFAPPPLVALSVGQWGAFVHSEEDLNLCIVFCVCKLVCRFVDLLHKDDWCSYNKTKGVLLDCFHNHMLDGECSN